MFSQDSTTIASPYLLHAPISVTLKNPWFKCCTLMLRNKVIWVINVLFITSVSVDKLNIYIR